MMLVDVYTLAPERDKETVNRFRNFLTTGFTEASDEYGFPELADSPEVEFESLNDLINFLIASPEASYSVYFSNTTGNHSWIRSAMLFFTADGGLILGLSVTSENEERALEVLREEFGGYYSVTAWEEPPPETALEFVRLAKT